MFNNSKLREEMHRVKALNKWSFQQMADSMGLDKGFVWKVMKGNKFFSEKNVKKFCEVHGYKIQDFLIDQEPNFNFANAFQHALRMTKKTMIDVMDVTGMGIIRLSDLHRGVKQPTEEEAKLISDALGMDKELLDEGTLSSAFHEIGVQMERIHVPSEIKEVVLQLLERNIRKPPTLD